MKQPAPESRTDGREMLKIDCPWCGPRGEIEFAYGGEAGTIRPIPADQVSNKTWSDYLYLRRNEKGPHRELWCHAQGCGQWFLIERDTMTHSAISTARIVAPAAERS